jgi:HSP20 family protein
MAAGLTSQEVVMAETVTKLPVKTETTAVTTARRPWHPMEAMRREMERVFADFDYGFGFAPFRRSLFDYVP